MEWVWLAGGAVVGLAIAAATSRQYCKVQYEVPAHRASKLPALVLGVVLLGGVAALVVADVRSTDFDLGAAFYGPIGTAAGYGVTKAFGALFD